MTRIEEQFLDKVNATAMIFRPMTKQPDYNVYFLAWFREAFRLADEARVEGLEKTADYYERCIGSQFRYMSKPELDYLMASDLAARFEKVRELAV